MKEIARKIISVPIMFVGAFFVLAAILPLTARTVFVQESIREILLAVFAGAIVLAGIAIWGWQHRRIVFGTISIIFGAVLSFMGVSPVWMKAMSPEIADKIPEMSVFRPLALGIICIVGGIFLKVVQKRTDKEKPLLHMPDTAPTATKTPSQTPGMTTGTNNKSTIKKNKDGTFYSASLDGLSNESESILLLLSELPVLDDNQTDRFKNKWNITKEGEGNEVISNLIELIKKRDVLIRKHVDGISSLDVSCQFHSDPYKSLGVTIWRRFQSGNTDGIQHQIVRVSEDHFMYGTVK